MHLSSPERDSLLAANLDWVLATLAPGARAVVWAHDVHVSKGGDPERSFNRGAQMGAYLRRTHGDGYRVSSLLTWGGAYTATRGLTDYRMAQIEAFPGPPGTMKGVLHALPRPPRTVGWIVDLRAAREDSDGRWLWMPRPIRHIGYAAYDYRFSLIGVDRRLDCTVRARPVRRLPQGGAAPQLACTQELGRRPKDLACTTKGT